MLEVLMINNSNFRRFKTEITDLYNSFRKEEYDGEPIKEKDLQHFINCPSIKGWIIVDSNLVRGILLSSISDGKSEVMLINIDKYYRGNKYGSMLMNRYIDYSKRHKVTEWIVYCNKLKKSLLKDFYSKFGYTEVESHLGEREDFLSFSMSATKPNTYKIVNK